MATPLTLRYPNPDPVVMPEAGEEATQLRQHEKQLVLFFTAMRHFAGALRARGLTVHGHALDGVHPAASLIEGQRVKPAKPSV